MRSYVSCTRPHVSPLWRRLVTDPLIPADVEMLSDGEGEEEGEEEGEGGGGGRRGRRGEREEGRGNEVSNRSGGCLTTQQERLFMMSRVRCACRLLVDCDSTSIAYHQPSLPDSKAASTGTTTNGVFGDNNNNNIRSCSSSLSNCWRDVTCSLVTDMLRRFDYTDSPHAIAADLLSVYDCLKQALLELFGGHSQFAIALKDGFSRAFQSMDEVTGVKVLCNKCHLYGTCRPFSIIISATERFKKWTDINV